MKMFYHHDKNHISASCMDIVCFINSSNIYQHNDIYIFTQ